MSFIQLQKAGRGEKRTIYVILASSKRSPGKKHPHQIRTHLGCMTDDQNNVVVAKSFAGTSRVLVSIQALRQIASQGEDAVFCWLKQHVPDAKVFTKTSVSAIDKVSRIKKVGITHVLHNIATSLGLDEILTTCFNSNNTFDGLAILYVSFYQIAERRPLYQAYTWINEHEIPDEIKDYDFSSVGTSRLSIQIGNDTAALERFFRMWIKKLNAPSSLIFDTTSVSSYSEKLDFAEWGYNRDGEELPQINISLVSSRSTGLPVYFRMLPGSIPDVTSLKVTVSLLKELGITDCVSSLDRGFYSASNVRSMLENNVGFVIGVSHSCTQTKELIQKHQATLRSPKYSIVHKGNIMRHISDKWLVDMDNNGEKKEIDAHIYWDYNRQSAQEKDLEYKIFQLYTKSQQDMPQGFATKDEAKLWIEENAKSLATFLKPTCGDTLWEIERDIDAIELTVAKKGFTVVLTTKIGASGTEILDDYRSRDTVEKLFDIFKNENGQNRLHSGNHQAVVGRLIFAFIAMILYAELENRMKKAKLLKRYSVSELIAILRKLECVTMESGNRYLMELTKAPELWTYAPIYVSTI
jgi:transposase